MVIKVFIVDGINYIDGSVYRVYIGKIWPTVVVTVDKLVK